MLVSTRYELQFVKLRPASINPNVMVPERKMEIIEAESDEAASQAADLFLAGRTKISLVPLHFATPAVLPH